MDIHSCTCQSCDMALRRTINSWEIYVPFFVQLNLSMFLELKGKYVYHKELTRVDQSFTLFIILAINIQELVAVL